MKALDENIDFKVLVKDNEKINSLLSEKEIDALFEYDYFLKNVDSIFIRVGL